VRLLGRDWVLWRDAAGSLRAAPDQCPHRGAQLSLGRVAAGELQCPYHGWRFAGNGHCVAVPAVPGFVPPASHRLHCASLAEARGLVWLRPDGGPVQLPSFDAEADAGLHRLNVGPFDVAASAPRIVENFLDLAHFGLVHAGWLGDAEHLQVPDYQVEIVPADATTGRAEALRISGCKAWQPRAHEAAAEGAWVDYVYHLPAPYAAVLEKVPALDDGHREAIALLICPLDEERSRVWFRLAVPAEGGVSPEREAALRTFQQAIFLQDRPVLESQRPRRLPLGLTDEGRMAREVHSAADKASAAYRRYLRRHLITFGVC